MPNHAGNRFRDDLVGAGFDVTVLIDDKWTQLSDNIRVYCVSDYFQDAVLLIDVGGTLVVNLNDATDRGWGRQIKRIIRAADRSFLLKLFGYGDIDMMNFLDDDENRVVPQSVRKRPAPMLVPPRRHPHHRCRNAASHRTGHWHPTSSRHVLFRDRFYPGRTA